MRSPRVRVVLPPVLPVATTTSFALRPRRRGSVSRITWRREENGVRLVATFTVAASARPFSRSTLRRQPLGHLPRTSTCARLRSWRTLRSRRGRFWFGPVLGGRVLMGDWVTGWWQIGTAPGGAALPRLDFT